MAHTESLKKNWRKKYLKKNDCSQESSEIFHLSCVTPHIPLVMCCMSAVTCNMSLTPTATATTDPLLANSPTNHTRAKNQLFLWGLCVPILRQLFSQDTFYDWSIWPRTFVHGSNSVKTWPCKRVRKAGSLVTSPPFPSTSEHSCRILGP